MKVNGSKFKRTYYCVDCMLIIWTRLQASLHYNKSGEKHMIQSSGIIPNYYVMGSGGPFEYHCIAYDPIQ